MELLKEFEGFVQEINSNNSRNGASDSETTSGKDGA
mgnify:CR=1 FL=1